VPKLEREMGIKFEKIHLEGKHVDTPFNAPDEDDYVPSRGRDSRDGGRERPAFRGERREFGGGERREFGGGERREFGGGERKREYGGERSREYGGERKREFGGERKREFGGRDIGGFWCFLCLVLVDLTSLSVRRRWQETVHGH
jgi:hypothetical protein